jgi:hypothetical protein
MGDIEAHESRLYSDFAPLYDKVFGKIFYSRLERVIEGLEIPCGASSRSRRGNRHVLSRLPNPL